MVDRPLVAHSLPPAEKLFNVKEIVMGEVVMSNDYTTQEYLDDIDFDKTGGWPIVVVKKKYMIYYENGDGDKSVKPFGNDRDRAIAFFKSLTDMDPYKRFIDYKGFTDTVLPHPELYNGPVVVVVSVVPAEKTD